MGEATPSVACAAEGAMATAGEEQVSRARPDDIQSTGVVTLYAFARHAKRSQGPGQSLQAKSFPVTPNSLPAWNVA
jgi:hypothetical protein